MEVLGCTDIAGSPDPPAGTGSREANGATLPQAARRTNTSAIAHIQKQGQVDWVGWEAKLAGASEAIAENAEEG